MRATVAKALFYAGFMLRQVDTPGSKVIPSWREWFGGR
jgi:hypothetical protein